MKKFENILIPIDFSKESVNTLNFVVPVLKKLGTQATLCHVLDIALLDYIIEFINPNKLKKDASQRLSKIVQDLRNRKYSGQFTLSEGNPADQVVKLAKSLNVDLIVQCSHGKSDISDALIGSVAEKIIRRAEHPVLTISRNLLATKPEIREIKSILFPTDFSEHSLRAFKYVKLIAGLFGARIYCLHVIKSSILYDPYLLSSFEVSVLESKTKEIARTKLISFIEKNMGESLSQIEPVLRFGLPLEEINKFAEKEGIDLIIMGTHGSTASKIMRIGSVAEKVVRHNKGMVLTVKN